MSTNSVHYAQFCTKYTVGDKTAVHQQSYGMVDAVADVV